VVTSRLLEAFLACPVKCHLLAEGELPGGTEYSAWAAAREESYRREGSRKLTSQETNPDIVSPEPGLWKHESCPRQSVGHEDQHRENRARRETGDAIGASTFSISSGPKTGMLIRLPSDANGRGFIERSQRSVRYIPDWPLS
jgi:hypothetical protein